MENGLEEFDIHRTYRRQGTERGSKPYNQRDWITEERIRRVLKYKRY